MKRILIIALSTIVLSCNGIIGDGFEISGEIKGLADGTKVFLEKQDISAPSGVVTIDTAIVNKGEFVFEGKAVEPEIHSVRFENTPGAFIVVVEKGNIKATINKDSIPKAKVTGTFNNEELIKYNEAMLVVQKRMMAFEKKHTPTIQAAQQKNDTAVVNKLRKEYTKFNDEFVSANHKYIETSPKSFLSVVLIEGMFNQPEPQIEKIKKFYNALDADVKNTKPGKNIKTKLENLKSVEVGQIAPDFSAKNPEGKMVSLKQSLGKVTIIDFWASWCAPCRKESPNMVALYNEFHAKGLNIVGVSLDRQGEEAKWKEAIAMDKLAWTQVSNLKFWEDPIATQYSIKSIPATFILDANGKIVAKNLNGAELKAKIAELLSK